MNETAEVTNPTGNRFSGWISGINNYLKEMMSAFTQGASQATKATADTAASVKGSIDPVVSETGKLLTNIHTLTVIPELFGDDSLSKTRQSAEEGLDKIYQYQDSSRRMDDKIRSFQRSNSDVERQVAEKDLELLEKDEFSDLRPKKKKKKKKKSNRGKRLKITTPGYRSAKRR